jgi:D-lactate dehydrogenase
VKIAFYEISDWEQAYIRERLVGHELQFNPSTFDEQFVPDQGIEILSPFVGSRVTESVLSHLPNLQLVATRTTGYDHIMIDACLAHGVTVSTVPNYGDATVAEFTFALLLSLSRKLYPAIKRVREEGRFAFEGLCGFDLAGKTIGIVGTGHIGSRVAHIAHGFGMNIVAYDEHHQEQLVGQYGLRYVQLEGLLGTSDVISLHVPYGPETHHLINDHNIHYVKKGAVLINTARGGLVETAALIRALQNGILAGAALDVLEEESFVKDELEMLTFGHPNIQQLKTALADHELMYMDNVIITPHTAFQTAEAMQRILDITLENIKNYLAGKPSNVVTPLKK